MVQDKLAPPLSVLCLFCPVAKAQMWHKSISYCWFEKIEADVVWKPFQKSIHLKMKIKYDMGVVVFFQLKSY